MNFRRRPILCTTLYRNPMQATNFGGTFDQLFLRICLYNFHRRCLSISSIPWCKKVKNDQKLKSRGGPALRTSKIAMFGPIFWKMEHGDPLILFHFPTACAINNRFWQKHWHILFDPKLSRTTLTCKWRQCWWLSFLAHLDCLTKRRFAFAFRSVRSAPKLQKNRLGFNVAALLCFIIDVCHFVSDVTDVTPAKSQASLRPAGAAALTLANMPCAVRFILEIVGKRDVLVARNVTDTALSISLVNWASPIHLLQVCACTWA